MSHNHVGVVTNMSLQIWACVEGENTPMAFV